MVHDLIRRHPQLLSAQFLQGDGRQRVRLELPLVFVRVTMHCCSHVSLRELLKDINEQYVCAVLVEYLTSLPGELQPLLLLINISTLDYPELLWLEVLNAQVALDHEPKRWELARAVGYRLHYSRITPLECSAGKFSWNAKVW